MAGRRRQRPVAAVRKVIPAPGTAGDAGPRRPVQAAFVGFRKSASSRCWNALAGRDHAFQDRPGAVMVIVRSRYRAKAKHLDHHAVAWPRPIDWRLFAETVAADVPHDRPSCRAPAIRGLACGRRPARASAAARGERNFAGHHFPPFVTSRFLPRGRAPPMPGRPVRAALPPVRGSGQSRPCPDPPRGCGALNQGVRAPAEIGLTTAARWVLPADVLLRMRRIATCPDRSAIMPFGATFLPPGASHAASLPRPPLYIPVPAPGAWDKARSLPVTQIPVRSTRTPRDPR